MLLEFKNGIKIPVNAVFGGPKLVQGVLRDTLRIEIDPTSIEFDTLKTYFKNVEYTDELYTYTDPTNVNGSDIQYKNKIGTGYNIFVSISDEERLVASPPGEIVKPVLEEVFIVTIAQMTYDEYQKGATP